MFAIITVGLNHSGKSYFAHMLAQTNDIYVVIESDPFRSLIRNNPSLNRIQESSKEIYQDYLHPNLLTSYLTHTIQYCSQFKTIPVIATCNGKIDMRIGLIEYLSSLGYQTIIIYCNPGIDIIKDRLETVKNTKDSILYTQGIKENLKWMLSFFSEPSSTEADYYREITDDQSLSTTIKEINVLINKI